MAGGRPTKYDPAFCDVVREHMSGEGLSKAAVAGIIGVCRNTILNWMDEYPEFLRAVKEGEAGRTLHLERQLLKADQGPVVTARIFALKNACPDEWQDRRVNEHSGPNGNPIQTEDVSAREALERKLLRDTPDRAAEGGSGGADD